MQGLSYPTETVLTKNNSRNRIFSEGGVAVEACQEGGRHDLLRRKELPQHAEESTIAPDD